MDTPLQNWNSVQTTTGTNAWALADRKNQKKPRHSTAPSANRTTVLIALRLTRTLIQREDKGCIGKLSSQNLVESAELKSETEKITEMPLVT